MHKIDIPQKVIDSCIRLRGRRHALESIEPQRLAMIVVDMQNSWVEPGLSPLEIPMTREIIPNINRLAAAVRAAGGIVAWTQSVSPRTGLGTSMNISERPNGATASSPIPNPARTATRSQTRWTLGPRTWSS